MNKWIIPLQILILFGQSHLPAEESVRTEAVSGASPTVSADLKKLELLELMNVVVSTVSRNESTVGESPAAVFVITQDTIRRSGATTIPELFRLVPGMNVARLDNNKWNVSVRGFNGDRFQGKLLVQIDGRTLYVPIFGGIYWDTVDYVLEDIERIEVIRGPGASVWGANAVNGIINIITKSSTETQGGLISALGGTKEKGPVSVRYGGKIREGLSYRAYMKGFSRNAQFASDGDPHDAWRGGSTGLRLDWQTSKKDQITFQGGYFRSDAERRDIRPQPTAPFEFVNAEEEVSKGGNILTRWSHQVDKDSSIALQMYWDLVHRVGTLGTTDNQWTTYDLDFQHRFPLGRAHGITYGLGYRLNDVLMRDSPRDNGFGLRRTLSKNDVFSTFLQDQIVLLEDKLGLTLGSKFEHNKFTGFEYQPSGRLLWTPSKNQSSWLAVSRAVRTPTVIEGEGGFRFTQAPVSLSGGITGFPQLQGNSSFKSEVLTAFELGYRTQATKSLGLDIALYYNVYKKLKVAVSGTATTDGAPAPSTVIIPVSSQNKMEGESYGFEVGANVNATDWWRLRGAYAFLNLNLRPDPSLSLSTRASAEAANRQTSRHQILLQSSWDLSHQLECDLISRVIGKTSGFNLSGTAGFPDEIPAYLSVDLRMAWHLTPDLELSLVGQNLLSNHHAEVGQSPTLKGPVVEIQRAIYGKAVWNL